VAPLGRGWGRFRFKNRRAVFLGSQAKCSLGSKPVPHRAGSGASQPVPQGFNPLVDVERGRPTEPAKEWERATVEHGMRRAPPSGALE
jgi:hypothetical protein